MLHKLSCQSYDVNSPLFEMANCNYMKDLDNGH